MILRVPTKNPSLVLRQGHEGSSRFLLDIHTSKVNRASSMPEKGNTLENDLVSPTQEVDELMQESYRLI